MDETYLYAHHFEEIYTPVTEDGVYMYYNYISERQNSVDYVYLSDSLNSKLSLSLTNASLSSSGTLLGLADSMSSPAPSFLNVMTCMYILNIESMSVSYESNYNSFFRAGIETESDLYVDIKSFYNNPQNFYFREIKLDDADDFQRNYVIKKQLFNSIPVFLGSFYLFDKLKLNIQDISYIDIFNLSYNISSFIFNENLSYPLYYTRSNAMYTCNYLLFLNLPTCLLERGQYYNIKFYTFPIKEVNYNIHNILYRNSIPIFRNDSSYNNYVSLCYRWLFHSQFSNYLTGVNFSKILRETSDSFEDYIFDITTTNDLNEIEINKFGFDSISEILTEVYKRDNMLPNDVNVLDSIYNSKLVSFYDEFVKVGTYILNLYNEYMNDIINSKCSIKNSIVLNDRYKYYEDKINEFETNLNTSEKSKHDIGELVHINSSIINNNNYNLFAPFFGNYVQALNLNAGFLDGRYSNSMAMLQLRYHSVHKLFCKNIDNLIELIKNNYKQIDKIEEPEQNQDELNNNNLNSVKDFLQIADIIVSVIPEQTVRGNFDKNVIN